MFDGPTLAGLDPDERLLVWCGTPMIESYLNLQEVGEVT
jgi:hypothetical protein